MIDLGRAHDERRSEAKDVRAGCQAHEPGVERGIDDRLGRAVEDGADEQARAANFRHAVQRREAGG